MTYLSTGIHLGWFTAEEGVRGDDSTGGTHILSCTNKRIILKIFSNTNLEVVGFEPCTFGTVGQYVSPLTSKDNYG
jgi:hypothetical protein